MKLVAFDLETTGLETANARIVEFCFVTLGPQLEEQERFESLVNPGIPIPPETAEIHGITDQAVADRPRFEQFAPRIQDLVHDAVLIAHNARFDVAVLHNELTRAGQAGLAVTHPTIDTKVVETIVNSHALEATYRRYRGQPLEGAHRAATDVLATVAVLRAQRTVHADVLPQRLDDLQTDRLLRWAGKSGKTFLDHERKFYSEEDGVVRFNFGKHRGEPATRHPDYLRWMLSKDFKPDTTRLINDILAEHVKAVDTTCRVN